MSQLSLTFYGKKTCVSCQKAQALLVEAGVAYDYLEIEKAPPPADLLKEVLKRAEAEGSLKVTLNSRSKIYREKDLGQNPPDVATALTLMQADPNLIKRPLIVDKQERWHQGFDAESLQSFLDQL